MNNHESKYTRHNLCQEMLETITLFRNFDQTQVDLARACLGSASLGSGTLVGPGTLVGSGTLGWEQKIFITGEGSSRIFPAQNACYRNLVNGSPLRLVTEGATQALEYQLGDWRILGLSNSGRTKELVRLFTKLKKENHGSIVSVSAAKNSLTGSLATVSHVLSCGPEKAVAATKSVMEQALWVEILLSKLSGTAGPDTTILADELEEILTLPVPKNFIDACCGAERIYFSGRNNGPAEELALKTNEIVRKPGQFLEGTFALHGIEEVLSPRDILILVNPYAEEEETFNRVLGQGVGMPIFAISQQSSIFPGIRIPSSPPTQATLSLRLAGTY